MQLSKQRYFSQKDEIRFKIRKGTRKFTRNTFASCTCGVVTCGSQEIASAVKPDWKEHIAVEAAFYL